MTSLLSDGKAVAQRKACLTFAEAFEKKLISSASFEFAKQKGFTVLSPVQNAVIPLALQQTKDLLIEACTGSGKTLAYLVPTVEILLRNLQTKTCAKSYCCCVGALLLAPTRELAMQIQTVLHEYLKYVNETVDGVRQRCCISSLLFVGGSNIDRDLGLFRDTKKQWENYTVLVATPGRLCALVEQLQLNKDWHVANLQVLVFDEADRLLMERVSFETQLGCILKILPKQRRTFLVSATLSHELIHLLKAGIKNPLLIRVETFEPPYSSVQSPKDPHEDTTQTHPLKISHHDAHHHTLPEHLTNFYCLLPRHSKLAFLLKFLIHHVFPPYQVQGKDAKEGKKCIIFFLTCAYARHIHKLFQKLKQENHFLKKTSLLCLYGKMSQKSRMVATKRFRNADHRNGCILLATDIAARGLDFPNVSWIIQYDPPTDPTMFVHRIGRTARAGKKGQSLLFLCPSEEAYIPFLENREVMIRDLALHPEKIMTRLFSYTDGLKNILKLTKVSSDYTEAMEEFSLNFPDLHHSNESTVLEIPIDDLQWTWKICRAFLLSDQALIRSAAEAVVSFIRAYKENHLQYIFVFKDLEIGELASSLGMLRLPRVKEILAKCIKNFHQSCIDPKTIPFKDPMQQEIFEKRNQKKMEELEEKKKKKQLTVKKEPAHKKRTRGDQRRAMKTRLLQDVQELRRDENLFKKLKRGKITLAKYDQLYEKELGAKLV